MSKNDLLLFTGSEWTFPMLEEMLKASEQIGRDELGLQLMRNQVEVITADQMIEEYTSHGMPIHYDHWSYGKSYLQQKQAFFFFKQKTAYEIVINTDPCIAYCMEEN